MSKIGKINILIPEKVKVILAGNILNIEGPQGKKSLNIDLDMFNLDIKDGKQISIQPKKINQNTKRLWGMNRSLINNAVIGSSKGYEKILELVGVGYRAAIKGNKLNLQLGYFFFALLTIAPDLSTPSTLYPDFSSKFTWWPIPLPTSNTLDLSVGLTNRLISPTSKSFLTLS